MIVIDGQKCLLPPRLSSLSDDLSYKDCPPIEAKIGSNCRRRIEPPDMIVLHWTGGEGSGEQVIKVLRRRGLSVHFIIERGGQILQTCDPAKVVCFHAGKFNSRSIGIEVVNYGFRKWNVAVPKRGQTRDREVETIHGKERRVAKFYPSQLSAVRVLTELLCDEMVIPARVPRYSNGMLVDSVPSKEYLDSFSGICGHFHLSKRKIDPGREILEMFQYDSQGRLV